MKNKAYSRIEFIRTCVSTGAVFLGSIFTFYACNSKKPGPKKEQSHALKSCDDLSAVSKDEIKKRQSLGYVTESTVPGSHCSNCKLYIPPTGDEACGGCMLFEGPVEPGGYCTQYESKG